MANAGKPARLVEILELQIFEEKSLAECGAYFGVSKQALKHQIETHRDLYDELREAMLKAYSQKVGALRKPPFRPNPNRVESDESMPTDWHDAMRGLDTAKRFCADFHVDNENRIRKSADDLDMAQEKYDDQLLNHYKQCPDFVHLEETLELAIDILSGITYRKFETLRDDK